ncbi:DNA polymerase III delta [Hydrogenobaculum sp. Y04AAS1]|uniref:DNA polymerase III subunit delta n=1 Tax=Hydrogenobaculum sp. (strain Y04AAS1) TaxID=380749 RepID=UPI00017BBDA2|nr:DNA polymerase III delta [Hydrogenobaculum sp. Y04AAS1]HCT66713.1 DNA polymerase III subunit delta [Hydrogenobaculum sp.]
MLDVLEYIKKDNSLDNLTHTVVYGKDIYFIQYFEQLIKQKYDTKTYWADELDYENLRNIITSRNIFNKKIVIIIKNFTELLNKLKKENLDFIKKTQNIIIFEEYEDLTEKDIKAVQIILGDINILTSKQKKPDYLKSLIQKKFKKEGIDLNQDIINELLDTIGTDSLNLKNETDKLLVLAKSVPITRETLSRALVKEPKDEAFSIVDALIKQDIKKALSIFYDNIKLGQHPLVTLGFMQKQFINMYLAFKMNVSFDEVCKILNISHPFQKNILSKQLSIVNKDKLFSIVKALQRADMSIKYYFNDPVEVLEKLIINIGLILKS